MREVSTRTKIKAALAVVAAIIFALYFTGRLDHALYPVGLNFQTCAENGFGAVFCGSQLTEYQQRVQGVQQQIQTTEQSVTQQENQALQAITQAECNANPQLPACTSTSP